MLISTMLSLLYTANDGCLQLRLQQFATEMKLTPFLILLRRTMDQLEERDVTSLFSEPVDPEEVI